MRRKCFLLVCLAWALSAQGAASASVLPWGDQGDGTYRNPILPADYSDPDVIRVGDDFYLVASEFHFMGIQVLHSRDLVNWQIASRVFTRLSLDAKYDQMRAYSQGTWAPSLRFHAGKFYLYVCTPQDGLLLWTAANPAGPWSPGITVKRVAGWEDPCPFWDEDGQAYLLHGRLGAGPLILHRMSEDGTRLLDDGVEIYRGPVSEGPKLFHRQGWYYISLPEGGVERGGQTVLRSRTLFGPYERRVVFPDRSPHQGGIVELDSGESWFIGFKSAGALGRIVYLNPVRWGDDGWPVFGDRGRPVAGGIKPRIHAGPVPPIEHPQTSDDFSSGILRPQWQWNHNPVDAAWSLAERPGWLRLHGLPAASAQFARDTLTQKLWGQDGSIEVRLDSRGLSDGQQAGLGFLSGKRLDGVAVGREHGRLWVGRDPQHGESLPTGSAVIWLRGTYQGADAQLAYSWDDRIFHDAGPAIRLEFSQWKGARTALFCYGDGGGAADFTQFIFQPGTKPVPLDLPAAAPIDRQALVQRHNPVLHRFDPTAPLTLGNGDFAFTADITGLQTFSDRCYQEGIPLETLARWAWLTDPNPHGYRLSDANQTYRRADGTPIALPTRLDLPAADWLRRNPRLAPLGQLALEWDKPGAAPFTPADLTEAVQTLDLWHGRIVSRYRLGGIPVTVSTACDPLSDTLAVTIDSEWVRRGALRVRLAFPRDHDAAIKNTPPLDWSQPESHQSILTSPTSIERRLPGLRYVVTSDQKFGRRAAHEFLLAEHRGDTLAFTLKFSSAPPTAVNSTPDQVLARSAAHWPDFWRSGAMVDFSGSTHPLAPKIEERMVLSLYLTAVQCASDIPPQESGLTSTTWYGKNHTEMLWWHTAHFVLWGRTPLAEKSLGWFCRHLAEARALAASRGLQGARWAKMVGPDGRESPGGNALIVWNQPQPIYLADLILRQSPSAENLAKYGELVAETAECLASMLVFDRASGTYGLGPPLWSAQELYDPSTTQNPTFELAYWRYALETAQRWRVRAGQTREARWDDRLAHLPPLAQAEGKYVALASTPDTWSNAERRHDHPVMLMPLGFLPGGPDVNPATMDRTLSAVLARWDWQAKIWGWDYPMVAMTATRLGRPQDAVDVLMREGPNNHYWPTGYCPQSSDQAAADHPAQRPEIAAYLPANGAFLAALDLMVAGWEGCPRPHPGFPADGTWSIRSESLSQLP